MKKLRNENYHKLKDKITEIRKRLGNICAFCENKGVESIIQGKPACKKCYLDLKYGGK